MFDFSTITEVSLASGKHSNPSEGLCFMEMAAWFAGENHSDKPACSSRVLGEYGIRLNDCMPDDLRDRLLKPLVPMIVGTSDPANEQRRAEFLAMWSVNKVLPITLREHGLNDHALRCEQARGLSEANAAADAARDAARVANAARAANTAYHAANAADQAAQAAHAAYAARAAANASANSANSAANAAPAERIWQCAVEGLRQAILIGRHDGFAEPEAVIVERHAALRELVRA